MKLKDLKTKLADMKKDAEAQPTEVIESNLLDTVCGSKKFEFPPVWGQWGMAF